MRLTALAVLTLPVLLGGCDPFTAISAGFAGGKAIYDSIKEVTTQTSEAVVVACRDWEIRKATMNQRIKDGVVSVDAANKAAELAIWLDATCDPRAPAPADPLAAAVWLAGLAGRIDLLTEAKR